MAQQSPAVVVSPPPAALLRALNPILRSLLRTPVLGGTRKQFMVLNFTGRKTGRQYSVPVSTHKIDGDLFALAHAPWTRNFRGGAAADVLLDGTPVTMQGVLIEDRAALAALYLRCAQSYDVKRAQRMMGLKFRDNSFPALEDFAEAIDREKLVAIRLTPT